MLGAGLPIASFVIEACACHDGGSRDQRQQRLRTLARVAMRPREAVCGIGGIIVSDMIIRDF